MDPVSIARRCLDPVLNDTQMSSFDKNEILRIARRIISSENKEVQNQQLGKLRELVNKQREEVTLEKDGTLPKNFNMGAEQFLFILKKDINSVANERLGSPGKRKTTETVATEPLLPPGLPMLTIRSASETAGQKRQKT